MMPNSTEIKKRLACVRGQIDGLIKMIGECKDCVAIVTQFKATKAGIEKAGALFAKNYTLHCLTQNKSKNFPQEVEKLLIEAFRQ